MKILYLYSGTRKGKFEGKIHIDYPDTQYLGLNHLSEFGIHAEHKEFSDFVKSPFWNKILGFRIKHFLLYFFTKEYDIVFGSSILYMMILKKVFRSKAKFVLLNISLSRTIAVNKNNFLKSSVILSAIKELDAVVCLSNVQKEHLEKEVPSLKGKVFFVPLGVDIDYYHPVFVDRKNYILSVGRDNGRDYGTIIKVAEALPEEEFEIVCHPRNVAHISKFPKNVTVFYNLSPAEVSKKYLEAKLLLLTTHDDTYKDGADCSGQTVILDAMASGLPVIATRKKYLGDYVVSEKEIAVAECYDVQDICRQISFLSVPEKREEMARVARKTTEHLFSTEKMAKNLALVFAEIV